MKTAKDFKKMQDELMESFQTEAPQLVDEIMVELERYLKEKPRTNRYFVLVEKYHRKEVMQELEKRGFRVYGEYGKPFSISWNDIEY